MKIPKDLTHLDFGLRSLTMQEASRAISFVWKGLGVPWVILDTQEGKLIHGTKPILGADCIRLTVEGEERRFSLRKSNALRYKFSILRNLKDAEAQYNLQM